MEVAINGASSHHRYMLTCKHALTCSGGLIEGAHTRLAAHTGTCLTGVTDSSNRDDEEKHTSTPGRLRRDGNTHPDRSRATSAARLKGRTHFCGVPTKHGRLEKNRARKRRKSLATRFSLFRFFCVSIGQEHPCLVLIAQEAPRGAKHNPMSPHALLHMFKVKRWVSELRG